MFVRLESVLNSDGQEVIVPEKAKGEIHGQLGLWIRKDKSHGIGVMVQVMNVDKATNAVAVPNESFKIVD